MNLGEAVNLSGPQFLHLYNGDDTTYLEKHCEDYRRCQEQGKSSGKGNYDLQAMWQDGQSLDSNLHVPLRSSVEGQAI